MRCIISRIELLSSDLIPVLSLTNGEPVQYILKIFYDFFHKSIFQGRTLRVHLGLAVTIANSNFRWGYIDLFLCSHILRQQWFVIFNFVFDLFSVQFLCTISNVCLYYISSSWGFRDIFHALPYVEISVLNKLSNSSTGQRLWPIRVRGLPCLSSDWTVGDPWGL